MFKILFPAGLVSSLLVILYAALLIIGNIPGAGVVVLFMFFLGAANARRERGREALAFRRSDASDLKDDGLGNDWPWKDCP